MLRLPRFTYLSPVSLPEALTMLEERGPDAVLMAGGTDLLVNMKHRLATPKYVIGMQRLAELRGIGLDEDGFLRVGAGECLSAVEKHPVVISRYPSLSHAAHLVSTPQVRAAGTIGGNACLDVRCNYYNQSYEWRKGIGFCMKRDSPICRVAPGGDRCWAVTSADTVPVLIALRAEVVVTGRDGTRRILVEQLYQDDGLVPLTLSPGEIVISLHLPPVDGWKCRYQKFRIRQSFDFPLVGAAVAVRRSAAGIVEECRIVLTAVASFPERALTAENTIRGATLTEATITAAGQAVFKLAKPMDNTAGSIFHRKRMARVLVERCLRDIMVSAVSGRRASEPLSSGAGG